MAWQLRAQASLPEEDSIPGSIPDTDGVAHNQLFWPPGTKHESGTQATHPYI